MNMDWDELDQQEYRDKGVIRFMQLIMRLLVQFIVGDQSNCLTFGLAACAILLSVLEP